MSRGTVIAYWLIPIEPSRTFFHEAINDLARRYDAPLFEPHVTVHVGANDADATEKALLTAARECQPISLKALEIGHSDEFIKTLFMQFALNTELRQLNEIIRDAAKDSSQYELKPHLSLLYKKVPDTARRQLAGSIKVPFSQVTFDTLKAVRCISPTRSRKDVKAWHAVAMTKLSAR